MFFLIIYLILLILQIVTYLNKTLFSKINEFEAVVVFRLNKLKHNFWKSLTMRFVLVVFLVYFREVVSQAATCDGDKSKVAAIKNFAAVTQLAAITKMFCNNTTTTTNLKGFWKFYFDKPILLKKKL